MTTSGCIFCVLVASMVLAVKSSAPHTVTFKDEPTWTVGIGVMYPDLTVKLGETLKFVTYIDHDVVLLHAPSSGTHWDQCGMEGISSDAFTNIWATTDFSDTVATEKYYTPPTCGDFYIACSVSAHCMYGQRIKVTVNNADGGTCPSACADSACVTADSKLAPAAGVTVHGVKPAPNSGYWGHTVSYDRVTVEIGQTVLFRTGAGYHDVATVPTLADFNGCDMSKKTVLADWDFSSGRTSAACNSSSVCCAGSSCGSSGWFATYTFTAETAGDVYFVCTIGGGHHCRTGQKLVLTVKDPAAAAPVDGAGTPEITTSTAKPSASSTSKSSVSRASKLHYYLQLPQLWGSLLGLIALA